MLGSSQHGTGGRRARRLAVLTSLLLVVLVGPAAAAGTHRGHRAKAHRPDVEHSRRGPKRAVASRRHSRTARQTPNAPVTTSTTSATSTTTSQTTQATSTETTSTETTVQTTTASTTATLTSTASSTTSTETTQSDALTADAAEQPYEMGGDYAGAFNQPIPADEATDPQSAQIISNMVASMGQQRVLLNESADVPGIYMASASDPTWTITNSQGLPTITFPIPPGATPGGVASTGSDAPMVVYDPSNPRWGADTELRLWHATMDASTHTITTDGYGIFHYDRDSNGLPVLGTGTGSNLPWVGLIRGWEVQAGSINHALRFAAPGASSGFRLPATTSDQDGSGPLEEGMRLQLDPSVDCDTRTVPFADPTGRDTRFLHEICHALQTYGMIMTDGSSNYALMMELDTADGGTADWSSILAPPPSSLWGNIIRDQTADLTGDGVARNAATGIPWGQMRVLASSVFPPAS